MYIKRGNVQKVKKLFISNRVKIMKLTAHLVD